MDWKSAPYSPRNIIRFESLPPLQCTVADPRRQPRAVAPAVAPVAPADDARWRRVLDAILLSIRPFADAWTATRRALEPYLAEARLTCPPPESAW